VSQHGDEGRIVEAEHFLNKRTYITKFCQHEMRYEQRTKYDGCHNSCYHRLGSWFYVLKEKGEPFSNLR
jgi:hypothetical protein